MTRQADGEAGTNMHLRKVLNFNNILGLTLPKEFTNALKVRRGDYLEIFLRDNKTIVIKRHGVPINKLTTAD